MGFFRLALAVLVMLSHLPGHWGGINSGQMAVLGFYFVSGYLMTMVYARFKARSKHPAIDFFIDRVLKLWPSYLLVIVVTVVFLKTTGIRDVRFFELIPELLIAPAAYGKLFQYPYNGYLIPPTWSLGVEMNFYLLVPIIAALSYRTKIVTAYLLTAAHLLALSSKGMMSDLFPSVWPLRPSINQLPISDYLGFDLPFLISVVFLMGGICYERFIVRNSCDPHIFIIWGIYAGSLFFYFPYKGLINGLSVKEALTSITFFLPIALALLISAKPNAIDRVAGSLAYPLFLTHFLAKDMVVYFLGSHADNNRMILQSIALSFVLAGIVAAFQVKVADRLRYASRGFASSQKIPTSNSKGAPSATFGELSR